MLSKIHSIVRLKNLKGDGLKVFLMVAFKPFKKGLGVYFQKGFVFLCFHISFKEFEMLKLLESF